MKQKNRKEWTEYFQEKLSKLYNYKYEKNIILESKLEEVSNGKDIYNTGKIL